MNGKSLGVEAARDSVSSYLRAYHDAVQDGLLEYGDEADAVNPIFNHEIPRQRRTFPLPRPAINELIELELSAASPTMARELVRRSVELSTTG